jgi:hypothetical protein
MPTNIDNIKYIKYMFSLDSNSNSNSVLRVMPITELAT